MSLGSGVDEAHEARTAVLSAARELSARGLVEGTSGNVSARVDDGRVCLTPSSLAYDAMTLDELHRRGMDGRRVGWSRFEQWGDEAPASRAGGRPDAAES